jgi:hypothetical protein
MITLPDEDRRREDRIFRIAILGSLAVHLLVAFFYIWGTDQLTKTRLFALPRPQPTEDVVMLSSSLRLEKRPKPEPVSRPRPQQPRPRSIEAPPNPETLPQRLEPQSLPEPSKVLHELAKNAPHAPVVPPKTQREQRVTQMQTAPPTHAPRTPAPEHRIAYQRTPQNPRNPSNPSHLSQEAIAKIESDLSRTIAEARNESNPLNVPHQPPAATRHFGIQIPGIVGDLRGYEGICEPVKFFPHNGLNYYYVICNVAITDGSVQRQSMPWPIHFSPNRDPFNGSMSSQEITRFPVPGPDPGWRLPPGTTTTPEMRDYAHRHGVDI